MLCQAINRKKNFLLLSLSHFRWLNGKWLCWNGVHWIYRKIEREREEKKKWVPNKAETKSNIIYLPFCVFEYLTWFQLCACNHHSIASFVYTHENWILCYFLSFSSALCCCFSSCSGTNSIISDRMSFAMFVCTFRSFIHFIVRFFFLYFKFQTNPHDNNNPFILHYTYNRFLLI